MFVRRVGVREGWYERTYASLSYRTRPSVTPEVRLSFVVVLSSNYNTF